MIRNAIFIVSKVSTFQSLRACPGRSKSQRRNLAENPNILLTRPCFVLCGGQDFSPFFYFLQMCFSFALAPHFVPPNSLSRNGFLVCCPRSFSLSLLLLVIYCFYCLLYCAEKNRKSFFLFFGQRAGMKHNERHYYSRALLGQEWATQNI